MGKKELNHLHLQGHNHLKKKKKNLKDTARKCWELASELGKLTG